MVLVTPNIPNNTIFAMSQTTKLYGFEARNYDFDTLEKELVNRF